MFLLKTLNRICQNSDDISYWYLGQLILSSYPFFPKKMYLPDTSKSQLFKLFQNILFIGKLISEIPNHGSSRNWSDFSKLQCLGIKKRNKQRPNKQVKTQTNFATDCYSLKKPTRQVYGTFSKLAPLGKTCVLTPHVTL